MGDGQTTKLRTLVICVLLTTKFCKFKCLKEPIADWSWLIHQTCTAWSILKPWEEWLWWMYWSALKWERSIFAAKEKNHIELQRHTCPLSLRLIKETTCILSQYEDHSTKANSTFFTPRLQRSLPIFIRLTKYILMVKYEEV